MFNTQAIAVPSLPRFEDFKVSPDENWIQSTDVRHLDAILTDQIERLHAPPTINFVGPDQAKEINLDPSFHYFVSVDLQKRTVTWEGMDGAGMYWMDRPWPLPTDSSHYDDQFLAAAENLQAEVVQQRRSTLLNEITAIELMLEHARKALEPRPAQAIR